MISYFFSFNNLSKSFKNLLIFLPIFLSNLEITLNHIQDLFLAFFFLFILTNFVYVINDYIDKEKDFKNFLKKNNSIALSLTRKEFILINVLFIFYLILLSTQKYGNLSLWLYVINFYVYCYFFKKKKYIDVISLNLFYIFRLSYGAELTNIIISYWFLLFFFTFFLIFSFFKRYIQIYVNRLIEQNPIIAYSFKDLMKIKNIMLILLIINFSILVLYFFQNYFNLNILSSAHTNITFSLKNKILIIIFYLINTLRLVYIFHKKIIQEDIYQFIIKDKFVLITLILFIIMLFI